MNCKKGDLAIVVRGARKNIGKTVTCLELLAPGSPVPGFKSSFTAREGAIWSVDRSDIEWEHHYPNPQGEIIETIRLPFAADCVLMPITPPADFDSDEDQAPSGRIDRLNRVPEENTT